MWVLVAERTDSKYRLIVNKDYLVGRKDVDILITEDPSISRRHAVLQVSHSEINMKNPEKKPILLLKDEGSKYGTFVNQKQVKMETVLKEGDLVTFGQLGSNFRLTYEPLIITTSCLDTPSKAELQTDILTLGGHMLSDWRANCTHLVMSEVKVTVKAVCAMVSLKPLVVPKYFSDLLESYESSVDVVLPKDYIPPVGEEALMQADVCFNILPDRATLFKDKTFIFFSNKQYKKLHLPVTISGGHAVLLDNDEPVENEKLLHPNTCIVHSQIEGGMSSLLQKSISKAEKILRRNKKRTIPESDIGLAVVYCSLEKYCNPNSKQEFLQMSQLSSQTLSQEIYVPETQPATSVADEEEYASSQMSVPETVFPTQHQGGNITDDETTLDDDDENIRKRFRHQSSDDSVRAPSPKQARIEEDDCIIIDSVPSRVKLEKQVDEEIISCDEDADTQPLPSMELVTISTCEEQNAKKNQYNESTYNRKDQEITSFTSISRPSTSKKQSLFMEDIDDRSIVPDTFSGSKKTSSKMDIDDRSIVPDTLSGFRPSKKNFSTMEHKIRLQKVLDEDLPAKLMKITFVSLVRQSSPRKNTEPSSSSTMKNFKKFKKTLPNSGHSLPRIIGGKDLLVFRQKNGAREVDMWLNDDAPNDLVDMENNHAFSQRPTKKSKRR